MNAAIAQHLNVAESAIIEIQEWTRVFWVRVKGLGARFVSKKVAKVETVKFSGVVRNNGLNVYVKDGKQVKLPRTKMSNKYDRVDIDLPVGTVVHVDTYTLRGYGKEQNGWFKVNASGSLVECQEPDLDSKTKYPHEIYEELSEGKAYDA